jgi:hypothetical protein
MLRFPHNINHYSGFKMKKLIIPLAFIVQGAQSADISMFNNTVQEACTLV